MSRCCRLIPVLGFLLVGPAFAEVAPLVEGADGDRVAVSGLDGARILLAQSTGDANRQLAGLVARLAQLEEELRRLRGRVEQLEFERRQSPAAGNAAPTPGGPTIAGLPSAIPSRTQPPAPGSQSLGTLREPLDGPPTAAPPAAPAQQTVRLDPNAPPRQQYEVGLQLLQRGDWQGAQTAFDGFVQRFPKDPLASNAAYWLGETYYIRKDYQNAAAAFARNYRTYGADSAKAPDNLLKLGMSLAALGDRERACQTYGELERRHGSAAAPIKQTLLREQAAAGCS